MTGSRRFLIQLAPDRWRAVDLADIYLVEASGDDSAVRLRQRQPLVDLRRLGELEAVLTPLGFVRIHRSFLVNPSRIRELRRRDAARGWEVAMEAPVNRVLPVAEGRQNKVRRAISASSS